MRFEKKGFTIIETLISLILISFSTIFLMKCMIVSLHGIKNSNVRFTVGRILENKKNSFLGQRFNSPLLMEGDSVELSGDVLIRSNIIKLTPNLKKIKLKGTSKNFSSILVFYKSGVIMEVKNE